MSKNSQNKAEFLNLHLWVSNMDAVGCDADYTADYLRALNGSQLAQMFGCRLDGQVLVGRPQNIWTAFRALRKELAKFGHGPGTEGAPAPRLTARLPESVDVAAELEQTVSETAETLEEWMQEAQVK